MDIITSALFPCMNQIIPKPQSISQTQDGEFTFSKKTSLVAPNSETKRVAEVFNGLIEKYFGFKLAVTENRKTPNAISLRLQKETSPSEGYKLTVSESLIEIIGSEAGLFYGLQTLIQMLPVDFKESATIPACEIEDSPRFQYRGLHFDVSRHFYKIDFLKKLIDLMALYKLNQFHWHLTDDQGWRIEIKKHPKLTEIGSKRTETQVAKNKDPYIGDGIPVEGFYTQEEILDFVAYAKARHINVLPEIDLPGHSSAVLAAYPELGCKENYQYKVQTQWGIFKEVFSPSEKTFAFLEDVLSEVIYLFPDSPYIHIGGDEVKKDFWKESAFVQELKAKEGLKDENEVQSYFIRRLEKFINSKGRKIIGWDEILEGGLAPNAAVMSWRGTEGGIEAAKAGHNVVMTPNKFLYFDYCQGDEKTEPLSIGKYLPIEKVYQYNPVPEELSENEKMHVIGTQACIWTEYMKTEEYVEYMTFPRLFALSEIAWTSNEKKDLQNFLDRLPSHLERLDRLNVNYRKLTTATVGTP